MTVHKKPINWNAIRFLPDESVWMIPSSIHQGFEIIVSGEADQLDQRILEFSKRVMKECDRWTGLSKDFLWEFIDRSKFPPDDEDWHADAYRFDSSNKFSIEFSHTADPYGLWIVELHQAHLCEGDSDFYVIQKFCRQNH